MALFKKYDVVKDREGTTYLFSCYSLVEGCCIVTNKEGTPILLRIEEIYKVM